MVFSSAQQDIRTRFPTPGTRSPSGSLVQSAASRACGPCTASTGICHTLRFSDPCGICPAVGRRHRKYPCRRAQAGCGPAIHVARVVVQQRLGASVSLTAQRPSSAADKPRSGVAVGWSDWLGRMMEPRHGHRFDLCESLPMKLYAFDLVKCFGGEIAFPTSRARDQWNPFDHQQILTRTIATGDMANSSLVLSAVVTFQLVHHSSTLLLQRVCLYVPVCRRSPLGAHRRHSLAPSTSILGLPDHAAAL